jgi:PleD family two-component response regulator
MYSDPLETTIVQLRQSNPSIQASDSPLRLLTPNTNTAATTLTTNDEDSNNKDKETVSSKRSDSNALKLQMSEMETKQKEGGSSSSNSPKRIKVLLVEDNQVNQVVISRLLEKLSCQVVIATHGKEALEYLENNQYVNYDLIFMDLQMPVLGMLCFPSNNNILSHIDSQFC